MGAWLSKIRGKQSTKDLLEKISSELSEIETFNRDTQIWQKKVIGTLIAYFSVLYVIAIVFAYYNYYYDPEWQDIASQLKLLAPFLVAPVIIFLLKRILTWWYHRKLRRNETQLAKLKNERTKILDDVMETETYKVAKELLDKYGPPEHPTKLNKTSNTATSQPGSPHRSLITSPSATRIEGEATVDRSLISDKEKVSSTQMSPGQPQIHSVQQSIQRRAPGPPLPRPVPPRERGYMDRVVEYLVGDGPSNRYALICKQCQSHNGMALKEEFEYIAYRCCYCFYWNPARKQRPVAPKLQAHPENSSTSSDSTSSEEDKPVDLPKPSQIQLHTSANSPKEKQHTSEKVADNSNQEENLPESDKQDLQDKPLKDNSENKVDEVDLGDTSSEKMEVDGEKMD